ncbi:MAG: DUF6261 family protein [Bacteroidales bacterium]|jgi:hypothetical protein|nr:DUF6261 family protein [Bacteroidales bacterium]
MSKIGKAKNYQYTDAMHLQFFIALLILIRQSDANMLKIATLFNKICISVEQEEACFKIIRKSDISNLKAESDRARDDIVAGIKKLLESLLHHFDSKVREAAYRLKIVFDTFDRPTTIINLPYDAETISINNLLQEWENKYMSDLEITDLVPWIKELRERNNAFDELTRRYSGQLAEKTPLRTKEVRRETDILYKQIILVISANIIMAEENGEEPIYDPFVNELNVLIKHYNDLLAQHLGRLEAKKEEKEEKEKE